jgi:hypothetical protein
MLHHWSALVLLFGSKRVAKSFADTDHFADPSVRAGKGVGLRLLACWDCRFESRKGMDVCCECCVLSGRDLCDRIDPSSRRVLPSVVCLCVIKEPHRGGLGPPLGLPNHEKKNYLHL